MFASGLAALAAFSQRQALACEVHIATPKAIIGQTVTVSWSAAGAQRVRIARGNRMLADDKSGRGYGALIDTMPNQAVTFAYQVRAEAGADVAKCATSVVVTTIRGTDTLWDGGVRGERRLHPMIPVPAPIPVFGSARGTPKAKVAGVPLTSVNPPRRHIPIPRLQDLGCEDLGSQERVKVYSLATGKGLKCPGWTWGNSRKPYCEQAALRSPWASLLWVYHGVRVLCRYDDKWGFALPPSQDRYRGSYTGEASRVVVLDGEGDQIYRTLHHELGHAVDQIALTDADRSAIMKKVPALRQDAWFARANHGTPEYFSLGAEAWAEAWARCATDSPWAREYVPIPCAIIAAYANRTGP